MMRNPLLQPLFSISTRACAGASSRADGQTRLVARCLTSSDVKPIALISTAPPSAKGARVSLCLFSAPSAAASTCAFRSASSGASCFALSRRKKMR